jgi:uncharacterized membrane protein YhaH (DUF805 family)
MLQNFIGFDGRIGRKSWWLGLIILTILGTLVYLVLSAIMGNSLAAAMDPENLKNPAFVESAMRSAHIQGLISTAIFLYPGLALSGKRLNDRDRPSWLKYVFYAPAVASPVLGFFGLTQVMKDVGGGLVVPYPTTIGLIVTVLTLISGIWMLIELGFLRGTDGPNQFGADPIAD